ncbi:MAG: N-acyl-phosphatidylethanolamine-hydrolyzing phospholipase D [Oleiphilaceae bacterium]|jgi:N-acyl-phosphatidylethanolamine-hydrolysing phospholipase D
MTSTIRPYHHLANGGFRNPPGSPRRTSSKWEALRFFLSFPFSDRMPNIPAEHVLSKKEVQEQYNKSSSPCITWIGHAAFIIRLGNKVIITDPFVSEVAGPGVLGPKRFLAAAFNAQELPKADIIAVSHNHYDHLDDEALRAYPHKHETLVIVPLGLKEFFIKRGYIRIIEQDWWQETQLEELTITTLPAVHFSGRGLFDGNKTLWASFAFRNEDKNIWFSGDTAKGEIFQKIGEKNGPFDMAIIGIGAYEPRNFMRSVHASPEDAVEMAIDLKAKKTIGMHWGSIMLTPEDPFEAPARFRKAAIDQHYGEEHALILKVGETISF